MKLEVFMTETKAISSLCTFCAFFPANLYITFSFLVSVFSSFLYEVVKTTQGWTVRAGEAILRGTFVCEYIGEVLEEQEANRRRDRFV